VSAQLDEAQREALESARAAQEERQWWEDDLGRTVKEALTLGVPLNTLATTLGVSRTRIRTLAR
jgi:hypothetical protein